MSEMIKAVTVMIWREDGMLLAVTRGWNTTSSLGMPGGKVHPGESLEDAAKREVHEETGITILGSLVRVYEGTPDGTYWTTCYAAHEYVGRPRSSSEGDVRWVEPSVLRAAHPFADYNSKALDAYQAMFALGRERLHVRRVGHSLGRRGDPGQYGYAADVPGP